jgi:uncharacterized protein YndB with AHSA1/START domain
MTTNQPHDPSPIQRATREPAPSGAGRLARFPDGSYRVTFVRSYDRPASELWLAVTEPPGLDAWYPTKLRHEGVVGTAIVETFEAGEGEPPIEASPGTLTAYEPPHLFEVTVQGPSESEYPGELGRQVIRMRVTSIGSAIGSEEPTRSTLVFEHDVETLPTAVAVLPGWHWCLESLAAHLGHQGDTSKEHHDRLRAWYQTAYA